MPARPGPPRRPAPAIGAASADAADLAQEALNLVGSDPLGAIALAERSLGSAGARGDAAVRTTAWRAVGLAARARGDLERAQDALRRAVRAAGQSQDRRSAAEARMTLSFVLLDLGRSGQALRQSALAAADLDGLAQARLQAQRALILQRCGRFDEALEQYDVALSVLRQGGDSLWESRAVSNRGVLHAYRGDLAEAERDLERAYELELGSGRQVDAAMSLWNLGCLARERGDVLLALERYDLADPVCDAHDVMVGQRLVDRASLLLSVGVVEEARAVALDARRALSSAGQAADLLECEALLARIALLDGDPASAQEHARAARTAAQRQGRRSWALLAQQLEILALEAGPAGPRTRTLVSRARRLAAALDEASWPEAAAEARLAAARVAARSGRVRIARELVEGPAAPRHESTILQVRRHHAQAVVRERSGDRQGAARSVRTGLAVLARHRASIGASDLRAHVPALGQDLALLGLRLAVDGGSAAAALREVERWRTQELQARPVRPPKDPALSGAVERLRRATAERDEAAMEGGPSPAQVAACTQHEREVVRLSRRAGGAWRQALPPASVRDLRVGLGPRVLVELFAVDGALYAVTVPGSGCGQRGLRLHRLAPLAVVQPILEHLQFALGRLATGRGSGPALKAALAGARSAASELDEALMAPLRAELTGSAVVMAPTEALHAVPWSLLDTLARRPLHVVRSGTAWLRSVRQAAVQPVDDGDRCELFVTGPGVTLAPGAAGEDQQRAGRRTLVGAEASVERTMTLLDGADVAHIAAHGTFRADNPLLSSLTLADGRLTVYDLEVLHRAPRLVVLAACHSGQAQVLPGNQLLGVAHTLLNLGAVGVIATPLPTPDAETAVLMEHLHRGLASGSDPAVALHRARQVLDLDSPSGLATRAGFELYGL